MHAVRSKRHVSFDKRVTVHFQHTWPDRDYRLARRGPWMQHAADRCRFKRRIDSFDSKHPYIFTDIHREHIVTLIANWNVDALSDGIAALSLK